MKNLLLISNSTNPGESYLGWPKEDIKNFCEKFNVKTVLFIPYAGVNIRPSDVEPGQPFSIEASYDMYEKKVSAVYAEFGVQIKSIHHEKCPIEAVIKAECIAVGGGNTFYLVHTLHKLGLMDAIRERVVNGMPYMGWSAGSNIACPSLKTTNDMPIIEPESFDCLGVVPFQINPHYTEQNLVGHGGETRRDRILEFLAANRDIYVVGLRERCILYVENDKITHIGPHPLKVFKYGMEDDLDNTKDLAFLLK